MNHPFDEFSKSMSEKSVPRRELLRRLGAVFVGTVLSPLALGLGSASANPDNNPRRRKHRTSTLRKSNPQQDPCKTFCQRCPTKTQQNQCLTACRACSSNPSRLCGTCGSYTCSNLSTDPNCGACGNNCGARGLKCCSGRCADLKTDRNNCGACGRVCSGSTPNCVNGSCTGVTCPAGQTKCGTICTNLATDNANCGACGNVCATGNSCVNGECTDSGGNCTAGLTWCDPGCVDLSTDPYNCGACYNQCAPSEVCAGGTCQGF